MGRAQITLLFQVVTVWLEGSILGTLLNYLVEKDPVAEVGHAFPCEEFVSHHDVKELVSNHGILFSS